jgi:hypothetical protein
MDNVSIVYPSINKFVEQPHFIYSVIKGLSLILTALTILYLIYVMFYIYCGGTSLSKESIDNILKQDEKILNASNDIARMIEESKKKQLSIQTNSMETSSTAEETHVETEHKPMPENKITVEQTRSSRVCPMAKIISAVSSVDTSAAVVDIASPTTGTSTGTSTDTNMAVTNSTSEFSKTSEDDLVTVEGHAGRYVVVDGKTYFEYFENE